MGGRPQSAKDAITGGPPRWLVGGAVERRRYDDPSVASFIRHGVPVVLTGGCPLASAIVGKWDFAYLASACGDYDRLPVHFVPGEETSFARMYGVGLGKGGVSHMSFAQFAKVAHEQWIDDRSPDQPPSPLRYYLQAPLVWQGQPSEPRGQPSSEHQGQPSSEPRGQQCEPEAESSSRSLHAIGAPPLKCAPLGAPVDDDLRSLGWS